MINKVLILLDYGPGSVSSIGAPASRKFFLYRFELKWLLHRTIYLLDLLDLDLRHRCHYYCFIIVFVLFVVVIVVAADRRVRAGSTSNRVQSVIDGCLFSCGNDQWETPVYSAFVSFNGALLDLPICGFVQARTSLSGCCSTLKLQAF